ncbi:MAG: hypothetical protein GX294_04200 [Candidatus Cloacimonetes bacterium]|nr:hypothetical protein [Candidatus Cloacimonadota bacterium]
MSRPEHLIRFDWEFQDKNTKKIPAVILAKTLNAVQRIVNMIANEIEGQHGGEIDRLSQERSEKYLLSIKELRVGSAHATLVLGDPSIDAVAQDDLDKVASGFKNLTQAIQEQNHELVEDLFSNRSRKIKALSVYKDIIPNSKTGIRLKVGVNSEKIDFDSDKATQNINTFIHKEYEQEDSVIVKGKLNRLSFDHNEFMLFYIPKGKNLKAKYTDDFEAFLLQHPRNLVQIRCKATIDRNNNITKISEVYSMDDVDLSPILIKSFEYDGQSFLIKKPIELSVFLDDSEQLYCVVDDKFALNVAAETREELIEDIYDKLAFMWDFYIETISEPYREDVINLRTNLLGFMKKINE